MATGIRIRTSIKGDLTTVQAILKHPMDTGNNRDPETGKMIPAFFINVFFNIFLVINSAAA